MHIAPNLSGKQRKTFDMLAPHSSLHSHLPSNAFTCPHSWFWLLRIVGCSCTRGWISPSSHWRASSLSPLDSCRQQTKGSTDICIHLVPIYVTEWREVISICEHPQLCQLRAFVCLLKWMHGHSMNNTCWPNIDMHEYSANKYHTTTFNV